MSEPIRDTPDVRVRRVNVVRLVQWAALLVLVLCGIALGAGVGVWASRLDADEAVEAIEVTAIAALVVLFFVHDHPPKNPPPSRPRPN